MTDLAVWQPTAPVPAPAFREPRDELLIADTDSWVHVVSDVIKLANVIADTEFVPKAYRGRPAAAAAAILAGRELGLPPMTALRHVQVVEGSPSLSAEYKRARILSAGHDLDIVELTTTRCKVVGRRRGKPPLEITYTIDDARKANLVKPRGAWETRPRRMLFARASTEVADFMFTDITNGLPTTELLIDGAEDLFEGYAESPAQLPPATPGEQSQPRKAQRKPRTPNASPAEPRSSSGTAAPEEPAGEVPQPPLPGEEETPDEPPGSDRHRKLVGAVQGQFKRLGFTDGERDQRLTVAAEIAEVANVASLNDMTPDELSVVADTLSRCRNRDALTTLLVAKDKAGEADDGQ